MPEAYTHLRCAQTGAALACIRPEDPVAFAVGANGPDILFCYRCWLPGVSRGQDLPALGTRMHRENTGAFLLSLLQNAKTKAQRSYALGFMTHYATDTTLHPYVNAVSAPGQLYGRKGGHGYFESAVDSWLHRLDTGDGAVPARDCCPRLLGSALAEVGMLLRKCILETYGEDISLEALVDAFHHTWYFRSGFISRLHIKWAAAWLIEPMFGERGRITGHMTPARLKGVDGKKGSPLPSVWKHPATGEEMHGDLFQLLERAERRSASTLLAVDGYWRGRVTERQLMTFLGSNSYDTGLPDALSRGLITLADLERKRETERIQKELGLEALQA